MPIRATPLRNNFYYHVFNRGVNKIPIFNNKKDYLRAVSVLRFYNTEDLHLKFSTLMTFSGDRKKETWVSLDKAAKRTDILAYCLMPNHFHLLIKQKADNGISQLLSDFQNSYTKYFNTKYKRSGHLFQGQFKSVLVESDSQLLHVHRYIHLNPYSSGIVADKNLLKKYQWSSFPEFLGVCEGFADKDSILSEFKSQSSYLKFIMDQADYQKGLDYLRHLTLE